MSEFPMELIVRCGKAAARVWSSENKHADIEQSGVLFQPTAIAVLRACGYAELHAKYVGLQIKLDDMGKANEQPTE